MTIDAIEAKLTEFGLSKEEVQEIVEMVSKLKSSSNARNMQEIRTVNGQKFMYCRWHQKWEPVDRFVFYKNKSKGYCKAAYAVWSRNNNKIKKLASSELTAAIAAGEFEKAAEIQKQIEALKASLNSPKSFDIVKDYHNRNEKAIYLNDTLDKIIEE